MRYELWLRARLGQPARLLNNGDDPGEFYIDYREALRTWRSAELVLLAGSQYDMWEVDVHWLRKQVLANTVPK